MCSMASTGSSSPTMRPTSRAHRPPQLTTCSAWTVPLLGDDVPGAVRRAASAPTTRLRSTISAPLMLRRLGIGVGGAGGVEMALDRVAHGADEVALVDQREHRAWPRRPR